MYADIWIVLVIVSGIVLDVILAINDVPNYIDTISARAKHIGQRILVLPFGIAMLWAHFWLNVDWNPVPAPDRYFMLGGLGVFWLVFSYAWRVRSASIPERLFVMLLSLLMGLAAGLILWPQRPI